MERTLLIIQITSAFLLIIAILMQNRGTGAGVVFGGGDQVYRAKRGPEKTLHWATVILGIIFFSIGIILLIMS